MALKSKAFSPKFIRLSNNSPTNKDLSPGSSPANGCPKSLLKNNTFVPAKQTTAVNYGSNNSGILL